MIQKKWGNGVFAALGFGIVVGDESVWWWRLYLGLGLENSCLGHEPVFFFFFVEMEVWRDPTTVTAKMCSFTQIFQPPTGRAFSSRGLRDIIYHWDELGV